MLTLVCCGYGLIALSLQYYKPIKLYYNERFIRKTNYPRCYKW